MQVTSASLQIPTYFAHEINLQVSGQYPVLTTDVQTPNPARPVLQRGGSFAVPGYLLSVGRTPQPPAGNN